MTGRLPARDGVYYAPVAHGFAEFHVTHQGVASLVRGNASEPVVPITDGAPVRYGVARSPGVAAAAIRTPFLAAADPGPQPRKESLCGDGRKNRWHSVSSATWQDAQHQ